MKKQILIGLLSIGLSACNDLGNTTPPTSLPDSNTTNTEKNMSASNTISYRKKLTTTQAGISIPLHYILTPQGNEVSILADNGLLLKLDQSTGLFNIINNTSIPDGVLNATTSGNKIFLSTEHGNIYSSIDNFNTLQNSSVGMDIELFETHEVMGKEMTVGRKGYAFIQYSPGVWSQIPELRGSTLYAINSDGKGNYISVGNDGAIWTSHDNMASWKLLKVANVTRNLYHVQFINNTFLVAGDYGTIVQSKDGGYTWTKAVLSDPKLANRHFTSIATIWNNDHYKILISGTAATMLSSDDNGSSWQSVNTGATVNLRSVACTPSKEQSTCYTTGENTILASDDKGITWHQLRINDNSSISFSSESYTQPSNSKQELSLQLNNISESTPDKIVVNLSTSSPSLHLNPQSCILSKASSSCELSVSTSSETGNFQIIATAANYKINPVTVNVSNNKVLAFSKTQISTVGSLATELSLNYTGSAELLTPLNASLTSSSGNLTLSTTNCILSNESKSCSFTLKAPLNDANKYTISANVSGYLEAVAQVSVDTPCHMIKDVQTSPYEVPLGTRLHKNECIAVVDPRHEYLSILRVNDQYMPEFTSVSCSLIDDPSCKEDGFAHFVPLQGVGFDNYLNQQNKDALNLCLTQSYRPYNFADPFEVYLNWGMATRGPIKGNMSLAEVGDAYPGSQLVLWDYAAYYYNKAKSANAKLSIMTSDYYARMAITDNSSNREYWSSDYIDNFNPKSLNNGTNLCQFYYTWQ